MAEQDDETPFARLSPDVVLDAVESTGFRTDGRTLALNSYENRVYQIGVEDAQPLVAKFYRPGRWTDAAIIEEHAFSLELAAREIPVVAPLERHAATLHRFAGYRFALFPRQGGRWPELSTKDEWLRMGRFIARIHAVGATALFRHRPAIDVERLGVEPRRYLLDSDWVPAHLAASYASVSEHLIAAISARFDEVGATRVQRIHGDCHLGNVLWTDAGPHFVDLDDCVNGPAIQDLWMLLSGERDEVARQLTDLLEGYTEFHDFDYRELRLIEALRSLRMIHYAAWVARRWTDPAFPRAFPWLAENKYWEEHVLALREQLAALQEEPLELH